MSITKTIIISQPFGLGDVIFCQSIAQDFISMGCKITWPARSDFIEGLRGAYPGIEFVDYKKYPANIFDEKTFKVNSDYIIAPLRWSESIMGRPYHLHMISKYDLCEMDWQRWRDHAMPVRNKTNEAQLTNQLGLIEGEEYTFISTTYGSDQRHHINIERLPGVKYIELRSIPGYSLFDWCGIIENASTIHAVSTSTLYLFEILNLKAREIHLYPRKPIEQDFKYVEFLFTKDYILH